MALLAGQAGERQRDGAALIDQEIDACLALRVAALDHDRPRTERQESACLCVHFVATVPARRIGDPAELGATCAFLCSAHAGYITGQNIVIDGGAFPGAF